MGLIDFIKDAGERIFGQGHERPSASAEAESGTSAALVKRVTELGIPIEHLSIQVTGDVATVAGTAKSQADREKVVLAVGNTQGIARVDDRITVEQAEAEATFYTVRRGDTLSKIAREGIVNLTGIDAKSARRVGRGDHFEAMLSSSVGGSTGGSR